MTRHKDHARRSGIVAVLAGALVLAMGLAPLQLPGVVDAMAYMASQRGLVALADDPVPLSMGAEAAVEADPSLVTDTRYGSIDASLARAGIVTIVPKTEADARCAIRYPDGSTYSYALPRGVPSVATLTGGDGTYSVSLLEAKADGKYWIRAARTIEIEGMPEQAAYVASCMYVDYDGADGATGLAGELCPEGSTTAEKVDAVYQYVARNLSYDKAKAASGVKMYAPDLDATLDAGKGICLDYAALAAGMLRSQGVPCKMVFGDMSTMGYHAWIEVWSDEDGWMDASGMLLKAGEWTRLDPTVLSCMRDAAKANRIVLDDGNYGEPKFTY